MKVISILAGLITLTLNGCAITSLGKSDDADQIVLTDATKRAITAVSIAVSDDGRRVRPKRVLCAEPSPDIAKAVSSAIEASLGARADVAGRGSGSIDASFNRSVTESIAQLGSRLATIQLLRDELADLCRAYANGAVSSITYTLRLSRLDKKMITLLVSEASAGALSRALVSINGAAAGGAPAADEKKLMEADKRIAEAARAVSEVGGAVSDLTLKQNAAMEAAAREALGKELKDKEGLLRVRLGELNDRVVEKWALETKGSGLVAASNASAIAGLPPMSMSTLDLRSIHRSYLDDDDLGTLLDACLTSMEDNPPATKEGDTTAQKIAEKEREVLKAELELDQLTQRLSPRQSFLDPTDRTKVEEARSAARQRSLELEQLRRQSEEGDGSGRELLRYCRSDMRRITGLIENKISNRYWLETNRNHVDLCRAALNSPSGSQHQDCVAGLLRQFSQR